jgi:3-hydroxy-3-methylglutaryl CoA synthase
LATTRSKASLDSWLRICASNLVNRRFIRTKGETFLSKYSRQVSLCYDVGEQYSCQVCLCFFALLNSKKRQSSATVYILHIHARLMHVYTYLPFSPTVT